MIACLAWGSLVWNPDGLNIASEWFEDGPRVPVEFARQSKDGRLTLVVGDGFQYFPSLWARMASSDLEEAIENLSAREGTSRKFISVYKKGDAVPRHVPNIDRWAETKGVDAIVWTGLPPKFGGEDNRVPSLDEAMKYLSALDEVTRKRAEAYVRRTPQQIRTPYRFQFERYFAWYPTP